MYIETALFAQSIKRPRESVWNGSFLSPDTLWLLCAFVLHNVLHKVCLSKLLLFIDPHWYTVMDSAKTGLGKSAKCPMGVWDISVNCVWVCQMGLSLCVLWLAWHVGWLFCSMRSEVVSSGASVSVSMFSDEGCGMDDVLLSTRPCPLSGDWGELSSRDAIRPFWYWERVI